MLRIDIPALLVEWIIALFKHRHLRVAKAYGLSDGFIGNDRIDQSDALFPLLWLASGPVCAYMDNMIFLESLRFRMQNINDIDINAKKSELIIINPTIHSWLDDDNPKAQLIDIRNILAERIEFVDYRDLREFVKKVANRVGKLYSEFIDLGLYKSCFSLQLLRSAKEDRVKRPAVSLVKQGYRKLEDFLVQPKSGYSEIWLQTFSPEKRDQAKLYEAYPFCEIKHKTDQLYSFLLRKFPGKVINVKKLKDAPESYPDFLSSEKSIILIRLSSATWKTTMLREIIMALKDKVDDISSLPCFLTKNLSLFLILPMLMSSGTNARKSENALHDVLRSMRHVVAIDVFANKSTLAFLKTYRSKDIRIQYQPHVDETVEILYDPNSGAEVMRIGCELLKQKKRVAFVSTEAVMARTLLDCVAYTNTVEAEISFKVAGHFDIVIAITNNTTPVHVKALAQMLYQICDCPHHIISRHREWNNNTISYKVDKFLAVVTFIEVEHQKRLSARYFIKKLCSLIASIGASPQLIKMDENQGYRKSQEGHDEENAMKRLKAEENVQWEIARYKAEKNLKKSVAKDLCVLFLSRAKKTPDLKSAIQAINAIAGNWCGYTIKSDKKRIGPREKQVWEYSYKINRQPYNGTGFGDKATKCERIIGAYLSGVKQKIISAQLDIPISTVSDTIK
ncbi:hypothetical protein C1646_775840 [Rhizophagus diaphanus]|nr:hypothetical protein C1646_775840 [Rhizophagus diaphanus] [Rhizophagus sp. MUCL 43196]